MNPYAHDPIPTPILKKQMSKQGNQVNQPNPMVPSPHQCDWPTPTPPPPLSLSLVQTRGVELLHWLTEVSPDMTCCRAVWTCREATPQLGGGCSSCRGPEQPPCRANLYRGQDQPIPTSPSTTVPLLCCAGWHEVRSGAGLLRAGSGGSASHRQLYGGV